MLGLPDTVTACLFDLDGVLTQTAAVHDAAWKTMFDAFLYAHAHQTGTSFQPFDPVDDYNAQVDGKPREDGVRSFLASRGIVLPNGSPDDPPEAETVYGLGKRKNDIFLKLVHERGVQPYPGSVTYLHAARDAGLHRAVVSASTNCQDILLAAGIDNLLEVRIDGHTAREEGLRGKPAPDTFLAAARRLNVSPQHAAVFEDAIAGVEAGRAGEFGEVVGVDRVGHANALRQHGANTVVRDLAELLDGTSGE